MPVLLCFRESFHFSPESYHTCAPENGWSKGQLSTSAGEAGKLWLGWAALLEIEYNPKAMGNTVTGIGILPRTGTDQTRKADRILGDVTIHPDCWVVSVLRSEEFPLILWGWQQF